MVSDPGRWNQDENRVEGGITPDRLPPTMDVDPLSAGAAILNWWEARKQRKLIESLAKSPPVRTRPKRKAPKRRRKASVRATTGAELLREQRLQLEREKFEWSKSRDLWNGLKWVLEFSRNSEDYDEDYDD